MSRRNGFFLKNRSAVLLATAEIFAGCAFAARHLSAFVNHSVNRLLLLPLSFICALLLGAAVFYLLNRAAARLANKFFLASEFVFSKLVISLAPAIILSLDFVQQKFVLRNISLALLLLANEAASSWLLLSIPGMHFARFGTRQYINQRLNRAQ